MKLAELTPRRFATGITFECPKCIGEEAHRIAVTIAPASDRNGNSWQGSGEFPETMSLTPSVNAGCWHGTITDGEIV